MGAYLSPLLTSACLMGLMLCVSKCSATFNLYISKTEVKKLLGLDAELFYVREGVVNEYAMQWTVKVPPDVHHLTFFWHALTKRPILYNMVVLTKNTSSVGSAFILLQPSVNVSLSGVMPRSPSAFQLNLPCAGVASGEVEIVLNLNVTSSRGDHLQPTVLSFWRRKICLKGVAAESFLPQRGVGRMNPPGSPAGDEEEEDTRTMWLPLFAYVIIGVTSLTLVAGSAGAVAYWRCGRLSRRNKCTFPRCSSPLFLTSNQTEVKESSANLPKLRYSHLDSSYASRPTGVTYTAASVVSGDSYASVYRFPFQQENMAFPINESSGCTSSCSGLYESSCCSEGRIRRHGGPIPLLKVEQRSVGKTTLSSSSTLRTKFKHLQIDRERVRLTEVVQEGSAGRLYRGWLQREQPQLDQKVLIKTLKETLMESNCDEGGSESLCMDGTLLLGLRHENILQMVGISFIPNSAPFLIYPDHSAVNLKVYLRTNGPLKVVDLTEVYVQAAAALSFIHSKASLHGDVASRNCVISQGFRIQLTDAALSNDLFKEDYEEGSHRTSRRPVRWMAPELLSWLDEPTPSSPSTDMWSFGVFLWELTTSGEQPYFGLRSSEIYNSLLQGIRLRQEYSCPDELYHLMASCWNVLPHRRPTSQNAMEFLMAFRKNLKAFV